MVEVVRQFNLERYGERMDRGQMKRPGSESSRHTWWGCVQQICFDESEVSELNVRLIMN